MPPPSLPSELLGAVVTTTDALPPSPRGLPLLDDVGGGGNLEIHAGPDRAVVRADRLGHVAVERGDAVTVHLDAGADPLHAEAHLYGVVITLLAGQQRRFGLHASTVAVAGTGVALAGYRGAGKTTTSLALVSRGAGAVTDDLTLLDVDGGTVRTRSVGRPLHVWPDTVARVGLDVDDRIRGIGGGGKLSVQWTDGAETTVDQVVVLARDDVEAPRLEPLDGAEALAMLHVQTSWRDLVDQVWPDELFAWRAAVADAVRVRILRRPLAGWPLEDLCERIEAVAGGTG